MREAIPPFPQYAFMAWCSVEAEWQLYFYQSFQHSIEKNESLIKIRIYKSDNILLSPSKTEVKNAFKFAPTLLSAFLDVHLTWNLSARKYPPVT
jgi:hypothetical protein